VKKSLLCVTVLITLGTPSALAEEITSAPSLFIIAPTAFLNWTGVYVGVNGGYGWANSTVAYTANDSAAQSGTCGGVGGGQCIPSTGLHVDGALAGGQIGFNWQINSMWLIGAETDYQWSNLEGTGNSPFHLGKVGNTSMLVNQSVKSFGTVRVRMGVIPLNSLLLYGTGGIAYGQVSENFNVPNPLSVGSGSVSAGGFSYNCSGGGPPCFVGSSSKFEWGWTAGAGAEYAITNNLTLKAELLYVNLGAPSGTAVAQSTVAGTTASSFTVGFSAVGFLSGRAGLNFKF